MKRNIRNTVYEDLKKFSIFAEDNDFIEVTEWTNGEGFDVNIEDKQGSRKISLLYEELDGIVTMANILKNDIMVENT